MNKEYVKLLSAFLFPIVLLGQPKATDCKGIRNGTFYFYPINSANKFAIIRQGSTQREINMNTADTTVWKVSWQNDCEFRLDFISKSSIMPDQEKLFYKAHHTIVKVLSVTKKYYLFATGLDSLSSKYFTTDTLWIKGK